MPYPASRVSLLHGFSVNEVFRFACQLRSWFVLYAPGRQNKKLRDIKAARTTSYMLKAMQERNVCSQGKDAFKMPEKCFPYRIQRFPRVEFLCVKDDNYK